MTPANSSLLPLFLLQMLHAKTAGGLPTTKEINTNKKKFGGLWYRTVLTAPVSSNFCESQG